MTQREMYNTIKNIITGISTEDFEALAPEFSREAIVEGIDAIEESRHIVGATNPDKADVGSIRADYSPLMKCNCIHASDSVASAEREMRIYFDVEKELCTNWKTMMEVVLDGLQ